MVGTKKQAVFGQVFRCHHAALQSSGAFQVALQVALAFAYQDDVPGGSGGLHNVQCEIGCGLLQRIDRVGSVGR